MVGIVLPDHLAHSTTTHLLMQHAKTPTKTAYSKFWCFTLNNPKENPTKFSERLAALRSVKGCVFQLERGESGTLHWQGYIEFVSSYAMRRVKATIGNNPHLEVRRGTAIQAYEYCTKDATRVPGTKSGPWEIGTINLTAGAPGQGRRNDLHAVTETIRKASSFREVVEAHPAETIRYSRGIKVVFDTLKVPTTPKVPEVWLYYGKTGLGKTRLAMQNPSVFKKAGSANWFDGYDHHEVLIIDDFGGGRNKLPLCDLLNYLDRYPIKLPVKGSFVDRDCSLIVVTTNIHPRDWYEWSQRETQYDALARRFTGVLYFSENGCFTQNKERFFNNYVCGCTEPDYTNQEEESRKVLPWEAVQETNEDTDGDELIIQDRGTGATSKEERQVHKPPLERAGAIADLSRLPGAIPIPRRGLQLRPLFDRLTGGRSIIDLTDDDSSMEEDSDLLSDSVDFDQ